jgi:homoserine kinase
MQPIRIRLPATSANLGPGFDAVGLAMALYLTIDAARSESPAFTIAATGRNAAVCGRVDRNLMLHTYREVLTRAGRTIHPLHLKIHNEIPLGMGCGSSAAALLAGVLLANHFGGLGLDLHTCMEEACRREGHPDNVAACALGSMTVSSMVEDWSEAAKATGEVQAVAEAKAAALTQVVTATLGSGLPWKLLLALPSTSLATEKARALLPAQYSRADTVANVQRTALLVAAFALGRGELLRTAMHDRLHQPYRLSSCPLLGLLLPLVESPDATEILSVTLSGAGPGVLLIVAPEASTPPLLARIRDAAGDRSLEILETTITGGVTQKLT